MAGIVVGYDGTDSSNAALAAAIDLAKDLGDPVLAVFGYGVNPIGGEVKDHAQALRELGEKATAEAVQGAEAGEATARAGSRERSWARPPTTWSASPRRRSW